MSVNHCRYMYNEVFTSEQRERTHIFNTFFYGQLTKESKDTVSGLRYALCHFDTSVIDCVSTLIVCFVDFLVA